MLALARRFSAAGAHLRALDSGTKDVWMFMKRSQLVPQLRARLRDPGIIQQNPTGLCGPLAVVVELARRRPDAYVAAAKELFETGVLTAAGKTITAEEELRQQAMPGGPIDHADWILAATMRDDANLWEDVDTGYGLESITLWWAMSDWTKHVLGLKYHWETCFVSGELDAIKEARDAVNDGGVAFLLIDSDLINDGSVDGEDEEEMWWRRASHFAGQKVGDFGPLVHSRDDNPPPDHWVVFLGGLSFNEGQISLRVWSWGGEYLLTGTADAFSEYLYAVVTGRP